MTLKGRLFRIVYPILMKFPECIFEFFWPSLRSLVETEEEILARNEFHEVCSRAAAISLLSKKYPQANYLKKALEEAEREERESYSKLIEITEKYGDYNTRG